MVKPHLLDFYPYTQAETIRRKQERQFNQKNNRSLKKEREIDVKSKIDPKRP